MKHGHMKHDNDTDISIPVIILKNESIKCNHKYRCQFRTSTLTRTHLFLIGAGAIEVKTKERGSHSSLDGG